MKNTPLPSWKPGRVQPGIQRSARLVALLVVGLLMAGSAWVQAEGIYSNSWVHPSATGNLLYRHDEHGVRITDFSACGYKGGNVGLPIVYWLVEQNRWLYMPAPTGGGSHANLLQNAIDQVSQFSTNTNGFRGVVYLNSGEYRVDRTLFITNSGVVLLGRGSSGIGATQLRATAPEKYTLLSVTGSVERPEIFLPAVNMANLVVPGGSRTFKVDDPSGLAAGDSILISREFSSNFLAAIDMDGIFDTKSSQQFERLITRVDGAWVTVDSPLPSTFEQQYGSGYILKSAWPGRIRNVGIEDIYFDTDFDGDEDHGWNAIEIRNAEDVWVRRVVGKHFGMSLVGMAEGSRRVTVAECQHLVPQSELEGNRRYPFRMRKGDHHLVRDCYATYGRHDFAFESLVPGPNANVRCATDYTHEDTGPHQRWSVGGLYDLINVSGTWGAEFLNRAAINVQNRGRKGPNHGWTGAYMAVWNCNADTFRVRNPPTARNWLIGSFGHIRASQWAAGADPAGTYESSGSRSAPQMQNGQLLFPFRVNPYSLYYAQLQQRLRWPESEFREYWLGDIDGFGATPSADDIVLVDPTYLTQVRQFAGGLVVTNAFDRALPGQQIPFTFKVPLEKAQRVVAASLVLCLKATGSLGPQDALYLDSSNQGRGLLNDLGWTIVQNTPTVVTLEIDPALLNDGQLNVSLKQNVMIDWAALHAQLTTVAVETQAVAPVGDTYIRGGSHRDENFGGEPVLWIKNEGEGNNSRRADVTWRLPTVTRKVVGATVRLFCHSTASPHNVYSAAVTDHSDYGEFSMTWNSPIPLELPVAYFVPQAGRFVEFSMLPEVLDRLVPGYSLSVQLWAPYDLGDDGFATFASREDPDPDRRPQLILSLKNEAPTMTELTNVTMSANSSYGPIYFSVNDPDTSSGDLTLFATSSNPSLIPSASIQFSGAGSARALTITSLANQTGTAEITVYLSDGAQTNEQSFVVHVGVPGASPVISVIPDQVLAEHTKSAPIPFTITDTYGRAKNVQVTVDPIGRELLVAGYVGSQDDSSSAPTNISYRYLILIPVNGFTGTTTLEIRATDGFRTVVRRPRITVNAIDDPPGPIHVVPPDAWQVFAPGQPLTIEAVVADEEGDLALVEFYTGTTRLGSVLAPPYRFVWANPPAGYQIVSAVAVDETKKRTRSAEVVFQVGEQHDTDPELAIQLHDDMVLLYWDADGRDADVQTTRELGTGAVWNTLPSSAGTNALALPRDPLGNHFFRLRTVP